MKFSSTTSPTKGEEEKRKKTGRNNRRADNISHLNEHQVFFSVRLILRQDNHSDKHDARHIACHFPLIKLTHCLIELANNETARRTRTTLLMTVHLIDLHLQTTCAVIQLLWISTKELFCLSSSRSFVTFCRCNSINMCSIARFRSSSETLSSAGFTETINLT